MTDPGAAHAKGTFALPPFYTIVAFWTFVAVIAAGHAAPHHDSAGRAVAYEMVNHWAWAGLTPLVFLLAQRFPLDRASRVGSVVVHLLAGVVIGIAWGTFSELVHVNVAHPTDPSPPPTVVLANYAAFGFSPGLVIYFAILAAAHAVSYYQQSRTREREALGLRTQLAEARLEGLRMQLQPHFLFNTLNTISGLVESDPTTTRAVVARLSELLRHTLEVPNRAEIALSTELELLESYLDIVRTRFGDRVRIVVHAEPATLDARVPPLCLQPLVENAVEHGVGPHPEGGSITVTARLSGEQLVLEVEDDGCGPEGSSHGVTRLGVGMGTVQDRLKQLHGDRASLILRPRDPNGTVTRVLLPFRTDERPDTGPQ